jgi:hypothetical protein
MENTEENSDFSSIFSISLHYSTYFSSIFSLSYHYFLLYFPNHFTFQITFLPYFPYHITIVFLIFNIFSLFSLGFICILMSHRSAVTVDTVCLIIFVSCVLSFRWSLRFFFMFSLLFSESNFYFTSQYHQRFCFIVVYITCTIML